MECILALDLEDVPGFPNKFPLEYLKNILKYNDDPSCVVSHVLSLVRYTSILERRHEDLLVVSFLHSLGIKQQGWIRNSCRPKSITSLKTFVEEFFKHCGPGFHRFEDTYHELLTALQEEGLLGLFETNTKIDDNEASLEEKCNNRSLAEEVFEEEGGKTPRKCRILTRHHPAKEQAHNDENEQEFPFLSFQEQSDEALHIED
jgi:hypothetical protein